MQLNTKTLEAFAQGYKDRCAGMPMTAHPHIEDTPAINDAYALGYDPRDEQKMTRPEYREIAERFVTDALNALRITLPETLPRNRCEFPE